MDLQEAITITKNMIEYGKSNEQCTIEMSIEVLEVLVKAYEHKQG